MGPEGLNSLEWYTAWWNLVYLLPFFVALLYMVLYSLTGISFGDDLEANLDQDLDAPEANVEVEHDINVDQDLLISGHFGGDMQPDADLAQDLNLDADADVDADAELDADAGIDAEADVEAEVDTEAGIETDADVEAEADAGPAHSESTAIDHVGMKTTRRQMANPWLRALVWVGVGKIPLSFLLAVLCFAWALIGFGVNTFLVTMPPASVFFSRVPALTAVVSLPLALVGSLIITRSTAGLLGRYVPTTTTSVKRKRQLVGKSGTAVYEITDSFGMANLRDEDGNLHQIPCRTYADNDPLPKGSKVLTVDYNDNGGFYWVVQSDL